MKRKSWRKHHKWVGLLFSLFLLMFCISGILLNHREMLSNMDISRKYLPEKYEFKKWNNGLLKGSVRVDSCVYLYGIGGIFKTDVNYSTISTCNNGLPKGADRRNIKAMVANTKGDLFSALKGLLGL